MTLNGLLIVYLVQKQLKAPVLNMHWWYSVAVQYLAMIYAIPVLSR